MSQGKLDDEQLLELYVLDYLVTRNLMQTAEALVSEANITNGTQSVFYQPGQGLLRGWWDSRINTPTLGAIDPQAATYAQKSAINSDGVPLTGEPRSTDFMPAPQHFDAHRVSLPQPNTNHQEDGGSIAQHAQGVGIVDNFNVVEMPSLMHGPSTMPTNYFGLGGAGFDQGTSFLSGCGGPSTGTHGNVDPLGTNIVQGGGLHEIASSGLSSQKRLKSRASSQLQKLQYQLQQLQQNLQHQEQQQNLQQLRMKQQLQQQHELQVKQQQLLEILQERHKQQLLSEQMKQQAFAQQPQVQVQQEESRKTRKPTSATEAGTSKNPVGHFYPAPPLMPSIGTPAGPTAPRLMTSDVGLSLARDSRNHVDPPAPSTGTPGVRLSLSRGSGNPVGPSSTATPGDGLQSDRDLQKGRAT